MTLIQTIEANHNGKSIFCRAQWYMPYIHFYILSFLIFLNTNIASGQNHDTFWDQLRQMQNGLPSTITPDVSYPHNSGITMGANAQDIINQVNSQASQQMGFTPPPTQEQIMQDLENQCRGQFEKSKSAQQIQELYSIIAEDVNTHSQLAPIDHKDPNLQKTLPYFQQAAKKLEAMIDGKQPINLKLAVFLSENPIQNNSISYKTYLNQIGRLVTICKETIIENNKDLTDPDAVHWAIQRLYRDTFQVTLNGKKKAIYPFTYDFEDFSGKNDIRKLFVTKLLTTHTGQCHSMPLLYAILAQELSVRASIVYSPHHSFIKYKNKTGWHNFESTCGGYTTDIDVVSSGFISTESVENGIYMRPISLRETVAECLSDLLITYEDRFGEDQFELHGADFILKRFPSDAEGLELKGEWITEDFKALYKKLGYPKYADLEKHPDLKQKVITMKAYDDQMDHLGFTETPDDAYQAWLKSIKIKQQEQSKRTLK